jgi:hypothetical protein
VIEITGLTARQVEILDILWATDSVEEVLEFIDSLTEREQLECRSLATLITLEILDSSLNLMKSYREANIVINKVKDKLNDN